MKIRKFQIIFAIIAIFKINASDNKNGNVIKIETSITNSSDVKWQEFFGNWANHSEYPDENNIIKVIKCRDQNCGFSCDRVQDNNVCTLKSILVAKSEVIVNNSNLNMCGFNNSKMKLAVENCIDTTEKCTFTGIYWTIVGFGCEYGGNDFMAKKKGVEKCWELCESTPGCSNYTWNYDTSICYLKKSAEQVFREDAIDVDDLAMQCGVIDYDAVNDTYNLDGHASVRFEMKIVYPNGGVCKDLDFFLKQKHLRMHMPFSPGE